MMVLAIILVVLFCFVTYALMNAASIADDRAEIMRNFKEEK